MTDYYAYDNGLPCTNPNCKSHGSPHPNCKCYQKAYAKGGSVCAAGKAHIKDCEYFAQGGPALQAALPPDDIHNTLGMAGAHHGLLGLLKNVGHPKLSDPDTHIQKIHDLKNSHDLATDIHGHTLSSGASRKSLEPIMHRLSPSLQSEEPHPHALKSAVDYLHSSIQGHHALNTHMTDLLGHPGKASDPEDKESRENLKRHLNEVDQKPETLLNIGGSLAHYLPEHSALVAAQSATAVNYLNSLKPKTEQLAPLDTKAQTDKRAEAAYDRQVDISQKPLLVLSRLKDGTLQPQDLVTVQTIYPGLYEAIKSKAMEALIDAQTKEKEIPNKQRMTMSMLLGQPLDFTQTPKAMQAIIASQAQSQAPQAQQGKKEKRVTSAELKQINKVDELYETPLESRQINRNKN